MSRRAAGRSTEARGEARVEARADTRGEARADTRGEACGDTRHEARADARLEAGGDPRLWPAIDARIDAIAGRQHGVIAVEQLIRAGVSSSGVTRGAKSGRLRRLHRGVYLVGPVVLPWTREQAAALAAGCDALVSHTSALRLWGIGEAPPAVPVAQLRPNMEPVHVSVTHGSRGRQPGIRLHRVDDIPAAQRAVRFGIPVTAPARTVLDVAALVGSAELERIVARLEREQLLDREALRSLLDLRRRRPGTPALRAILDAPGEPALTRSEAEDRSRALMREARLPDPLVNVRFGPYELDLFWPTERIAVEIDGFAHHSSRPRFEGDRRKDAWLLARGVTVIRLSWRQITEDPVATAVQVGQALARAAALREGR